MATYENFLGFTFKGKHSSDFGVFRVSDGSQYDEPFYSDIQENTKTVMGKIGSYYRNTQIGEKRMTIHCACAELTPSRMMAIKQWLYPQGFGYLIFDETPYKQYSCKVSSDINFGNMPSTNPLHGFFYNGEFSFEILIPDPFAYSVIFSASPWSGGPISDLWKYDSNILLTTQTPITSHTDITAQKDLILYNAGNIEVYPKVIVAGTGSNIRVSANIGGNYKGFTIDNIDGQTFVYDCEKKQASIGSSAMNYKLADDTPMSIVPTITTPYYDNVLVTNIPENNEANLTLQNKGDIWSVDATGRYVLVNTTWYVITSRINDYTIKINTGGSYIGSPLNEVRVATMGRVRVTGSDYAYTSEQSGFNQTITDVKVNSALKNPLIKGKTNASAVASGVSAFTVSTHNTPGTTYTYTPNNSTTFNLYSLPNGITDEINNTTYKRNVEKHTFDFYSDALNFSYKMTSLSGVTLQNVALFSAIADVNGNSLYSLGAVADNSYKNRFLLYRGTTYVEQVEADQVDKAENIGKYFYRYELLNGVPTCRVMLIVNKSDSSVSQTYRAVYDCEISEGRYVDTIKLRSWWYNGALATPSVSVDNATMLWYSTNRLIEVSYVGIDKASNAGTAYHVAPGNILYLIVAKGAFTKENLVTEMDYAYNILYQKYIPETVALAGRLTDLKFTSSSDYLTYSGSSLVPDITYTIDMTPKPFDIDVSFDYRHKYI